MISPRSTRRDLPRSFEILERGSKTLAVRRSHRDRLLAWGILDLDGKVADPARRLRVGRASHVSIPGPEGGRPERLFVREYRHGGLFAGILRNIFVGEGRPFREIRITEDARAGGVDTPEVLACVGTRGRLFQRWSMVQAELEEGEDLEGLLLRMGRSADLEVARRRRRIARAAARAVRKLHDLGIFHADLHLKNLMVRPGDDDRPVIVDFDKSTRHERLGRDRRLRNLLRLDRSVEKLNLRGGAIPRTDRMRFLREYFRAVPVSREEIRQLLKRHRQSIGRHRAGWLLGRWLRRGRMSR